MNRSRTALNLAVSSLAVLAAACGGGGGNDSAAPAADRTVKVEMVDIAFRPATIEVHRGETVRFVFDNAGDVAHEAFIGDAMAQADHEREMRDMGNMHHGGSSEGITVAPDETGELTHTFDDDATVEIGCHQPGHYQAGMKLTVTVA